MIENKLLKDKVRIHKISILYTYTILQNAGNNVTSEDIDDLSYISVIKAANTFAIGSKISVTGKDEERNIENNLTYDQIWCSKIHS